MDWGVKCNLSEGHCQPWGHVQVQTLRGLGAVSAITWGPPQRQLFRHLFEDGMECLQKSLSAPADHRAGALCCTLKFCVMGTGRDDSCPGRYSRKLIHLAAMVTVCHTRK